jgi:hypothetical protein
MYMSHGPGHIQRAIVRALQGRPRQVQFLARHAFGVAVVASTQLASVRRALRMLARQGVVATIRGDDGRNRWTLIDQEQARRTEERARRAERRLRRDQQQLADARAVNAPCPHCGLSRTVEGHDGCLGTLPGVQAACCGHGVEDGYVLFDTGKVIRGRFDHVWPARAPAKG